MSSSRQGSPAFYRGVLSLRNLGDFRAPSSLLPAAARRASAGYPVPDSRSQVPVRQDSYRDRDPARRISSGSVPALLQYRGAIGNPSSCSRALRARIRKPVPDATCCAQANSDHVRNSRIIAGSERQTSVGPRDSSAPSAFRHLVSRAPELRSVSSVHMGTSRRSCFFPDSLHASPP